MARPAQKQIKEGTKALKETMQIGLANIAKDLINKIMRNARKSTAANIGKSIKGLSLSGVNQYKKDVLYTMAYLANEAIKQARKEVPQASKIKLAETNDFDGSIHLASKEEVLFNSLPTAVKKRIKSAADLLVGTQVNDLEKAIYFQFNSSSVATDSMNLLEYEISEAGVDYIEGPSITSGAGVTASNVVNEARNSFFMDNEVLEEIDAFQFVNGDPVTEICNSLAGIIFAKDDPDMFKYTPPLHFNCKSYIVPITKGNLKGRQIKKLKSKYDDKIQFSEIHEASCKCSEHFN